MPASSVGAGLSVANAMLTELFPTEVRAIGVTFPYAVAVALFGGSAPYIMTFLAGHDHVLMLAIYATLLSTLSLITVLRMPERARQPLP